MASAPLDPQIFFSLCPYIQKQMPLLETWIYPKDLGLAARFIEELVQDKSSFALYGAGIHTVQLLEKLSALARQKLLYILDAFPDQKAFPVPVLHPKMVAPKLPKVIILSHYDFESSMREDLLYLGVPDETIFPIYSNPLYRGYFSESLHAESLTAKDSPAEHGSTKSMLLQDRAPVPCFVRHKTSEPTLAFITLRRGRKILRDSACALLKPLGYATIHLDMSREEGIDLNAAFDQTIDCQRSLAVLFSILQQLVPDLIYIHDQVETLYFLPRLISELLPEAKIIWEPYDLFSFWPQDEAILSSSKPWSEREIRFIRENEAFNLKQADGLVYKEIGSATKAFLSEKRGKPSLYFNQYLPQRLNHDCPKPYRPPFRLVYAGALLTQKEDLFNGDGYLVDLFEKLLAQGLELGVFASLDSGQLAASHMVYLELARRFDNLSISPKLPLEELIPSLAQGFHFGLLLGRYNEAIVNLHQTRLSTTFSAKFWTYMAAGLPVIVNEELQGMAAFVKKYGVGMIIPYKAHERLGQSLAALSENEYHTLQQNAVRLANAFCIENQISELDAFFKSLLE